MCDPEMQLWGGVECTVNRVGDVFFDQIERTGHAARMDDLDRLAALGVRAVRYPILWERAVRSGSDQFDFSWSDQRLMRLRELGIRVIAGLVHHGSGPIGTSLLEESFVQGLARFARAVAERYPWIEDFTPVNEPLTTARFSALYGHWYPHARATEPFLRALMIQVRATAAAMGAIRQITPCARLIQTEDFGTTFSTPNLRYQAQFENHRKWLSLDLLCGRLSARHALYEFLVAHDVDPRELSELEHRPCPPDLVGVNYYVTSDRFLDERLAHYPESVVGSNGRDRYADVEAVRARREGIVGHQEVLESAWARYGIPLAITEAHLGCTSEEQVRWLCDAWEGARRAKSAGADVRAVTLWSVFGAYDWDSLVTLARGHYEPGAFDIRGPLPQPTAVARVALDLARFGQSDHPVLATPGWWRTPQRFLPFLYSEQTRMPTLTTGRKVRPVLITGAGGTLAEVFRRVCEERGLAAYALGRSELDITNRDAVELVMEQARPWLVVNAAGVPWSRNSVDDADACFRENVEGAKVLARECREKDVRLITFSSALVFSGEKDGQHVEGDPVDPTNVLGLSHAAAESAVSEICPNALVIRPGTLFDAVVAKGRLWRAVRQLARGESVSVSQESYWSLAYAPELAHKCLDLTMADMSGVVHLAHQGEYTIFEFLRHFASALGLAGARLIPTTREQCRIWAKLPRRATLASERIAPLSPLDTCLERLSAGFSADLRAGRAA